MNTNIDKLVSTVVRKILMYNKSADRDDLIGQAYLIVTEQIPKYRKGLGNSMYTYLYGQVFGRLRTYVSRDNNKHMYGLEGMRRVSEEALDTCSYTEDVDTRIDVENFLSGLTEEDRRVALMLSEGCTYREIAEELNVSISSITRRLNTWRLKLND